MKKELINKIKKTLKNRTTWWIENDTLYVENCNNSKTSEVYEDDLKVDFYGAINCVLDEIDDNFLNN